MSNPQIDVAAEYATRAAQVAQNLKPGTFDSVQAMALVSIAISLNEIAKSQERHAPS